MKKIILSLALSIFAVANLFAAQMFPAKGRVIDQQGAAVEYATVVLLKDGEQVTGMTTNTEGRFALDVPAGEYTLSIQYLGLEPIMQPVSIETENYLGDFTMQPSSTQLDAVVVTRQFIRREADRFVVDVANTPSSIGKDGIQLLENAPGVWIDKDKISINGKGGTKVYVNERELRMEPEQLLNYLRSLSANEIQKIEIIPIAGADYDASASGGIIKITLKKRLENGLDGYISMTAIQGKLSNIWWGDSRVNFRRNKFDFYLGAWCYVGDINMKTVENTTYSTQDATLNSHSTGRITLPNHGFKGGVIYEINPKHSIGTEMEYYIDNVKSRMNSITDFNTPEGLIHTASTFDSRPPSNTFTATVNYIYKVDTLGSTLKVLADYVKRNMDSRSNNISTITDYITPALPIDSLYRNNSTANYNIASATVALDKKFSPRWSMRTGVKYTFNDLKNSALYEYEKGGEWLPNDNNSFSINYNENIAAIYGVATANLGRVNIVAGLRGEYTNINGEQGKISQDYFSLFPNGNISYSLTKNGAYSLIAQYARTIRRPAFWQLNPQRFQISDYTYQMGNPALDPAFKHDLSLTLVLKYKYTFTGGMNIIKGEVQQMMLADKEDPNKINISWENFNSETNYYAVANLPFQLTKWWTMNLNATYLRQAIQVEKESPTLHYNVYMVNNSMTFTLPAKFYIDLSYRYQSRVDRGTLWVEPMHFLTAGVKKRFGDNFTATFSAQNIINQTQHAGGRGEGFERRLYMQQMWNKLHFRIGLTYNFKSGKAFRAKSLESGAADEKGRMSQ